MMTFPFGQVGPRLLYISCGGGDAQSVSNSTFQRKGTTINQRGTKIPDFLSSIIQGLSKSNQPSTGMQSSEDNFLTGLINRDNVNSIPGTSVSNTAYNIDPTNYDGKSGLLTQATRDPFSSTYADSTAAKYADTAQQAVASVSSGADAVRGGTSRGEVMKGDVLNQVAMNRTAEVREAQMQDASLGNQASQIMAAIESGRRALMLQGQNNYVTQYLASVGQSLGGANAVEGRRGTGAQSADMASRVLGIDQARVDEDLAGVGAQSASSQNWNLQSGVSCCFIFLEALNGDLPWYVRRGRDVLCTPERRAGYVSMSKWLVPLMQKHASIKWFVNQILVKPFLSYGKWFFGEEQRKGRFWKPYCHLWFALWSHLGKKEVK